MNVQVTHAKMVLPAPTPETVQMYPFMRTGVLVYQALLTDGASMILFRSTKQSVQWLKAKTVHCSAAIAMLM